MYAVQCIGVHYPHPCHQVATPLLKPINESDGVEHIMVEQGERKLDLHHIHPWHTNIMSIFNNKHAVALGLTPSPQGHWMDAFMLHAVCATGVAWGKKVAIAEWKTDILHFERSTASGHIPNCWATHSWVKYGRLGSSTMMERASRSSG